MSFSSSFLVSLFSDIKPIYFDPFKRYKNSMYYKYDPFVCYNYESLEVSLDKLLELNEFEFQKLKKQISLEEFGNHDFQKSGVERFVHEIKHLNN